jgi:hypothetical protein
MTCAVIGDSIAVIMAAALPHCSKDAVGGITSSDYALHHAHTITSDLTVISLGANDRLVDTQSALRAVRGRIITGQVVWLMPNIRRQQTLDAIAIVAAAFGDRVIHTGPYLGGRLHPTPAQAAAIATAVQPG